MPLTREEFRNLFDEQRDPLFRFLHRLTRNQADAEDLLQETFLSVWRKRGQGEAWRNPAAFLRAVALRLWLDSRRRTVRRRELALWPRSEAVAPPADEQVAADDERALRLARVRLALGDLPEALREAFELYRVHGLSIREIAQSAGAPVKTIETRIRRATLALSAALNPVLGVHERCPRDE